MVTRIFDMGNYHWIYILRCENKTYYVGETTRLYTRLNEHHTSCGSVTTSNNKPVDLLCVYKIYDLHKYIQTINGSTPNVNEKQMALAVENFITEMLIVYFKSVYNFKHTDVKGGKYNKYDESYSVNQLTSAHHGLPMCNCKLPCDVHIDYKHVIHFRCAKTNIWDDLRDNYCSTNEPCSFRKVYDKHVNFVEQTTERYKKSVQLCKQSYIWLKNVPFQCRGRPCVFCDKSVPDITLLYWEGYREVCFDCFQDSYENVRKHYINSGCISPMFLSSDDEC